MSDSIRATPTVRELLIKAGHTARGRGALTEVEAINEAMKWLAHRLADALAEVERLRASREDWRTAAHDDVDEVERLREERDRLDDACFELRQRAEAAEAKLAEAQQRIATALKYLDCGVFEMSPIQALFALKGLDERGRLLGLEDAK